jgi:PEP-CTERM motif
MKLYVFLSALLAGSVSEAAVIGWNFTDDDAVFDTGTPVNFTISPFSIGNTFGTVADPVNPTSASTGYTGASGTGNIGNAVNIGALNAATSAFYSVTITPTSGFSIQLSDLDFGTRSTATGPQGFALRSSADGFVTDILTGTIANNSTWSLKDNTFGTFTGPLGVAVEFRLYAFGGTGSPTSGTINSRLDDISFSVDAVPEPSAVLALLGGAGVISLLRRRTSSV